MATDYSVSFTSRVILGVQSLGDISARKAVDYITVVFKITTLAGGCFMRTAWNFSTGATSNKYGGQKQVYFATRTSQGWTGIALAGIDHTWYRHRPRGRGQALSIILENEGDKDFHVIGWVQEFHGKN